MKKVLSGPKVTRWFLIFGPIALLAILASAFFITADNASIRAVHPFYILLAGFMLAVFLIAGLFSLYLRVYTRSVARQLEQLEQATRALGDGLDVLHLPVTSEEELGRLKASFNIMARQIREKMAELQQERHGSMRSVIDAEEMERQRLSRELHDGIGQLLIAIRLRLESLLYQEDRDLKSSIQELRRYFDQIIDEVRRISNNLMPSVLEAFGIKIAFRNLFSETEEHSGLRIRFEAKGDYDDLDNKTKTYIYRLTQEAISNIVKHAAASEVWVNLSRQGDSLTVVIRDNGRGFSPEKAGKEGGNGIHNMRERVSILEGEITIRSGAGQGTTITVNVPIIPNDVKNQDFPRG